jgi:hypothetical protein
MPPLIFAVPFPPCHPKPNMPATDTVPPFIVNMASEFGSKPIHRWLPKLADPPDSTTISALLL